MSLTLSDAELESMYGESHRIGPPFIASHWMDRNWERCVADPSGMVVFEFDPFGRIGETCGVYFLWEPSGALAYVGMTKEAEHRLYAHWRKGVIPFDAYSFLPLRQEVCEMVEAAHIYALQPPYNAKYAPTCWGGHDMMVARIREVWSSLRRKVTEGAL